VVHLGVVVVKHLSLPVLVAKVHGRWDSVQALNANAVGTLEQNKRAPGRAWISCTGPRLLIPNSWIQVA
jgi:hypothetical protein